MIWTSSLPLQPKLPGYDHVVTPEAEALSLNAPFSSQPKLLCSGAHPDPPTEVELIVMPSCFLWPKPPKFDNELQATHKYHP